MDPRVSSTRPLVCLVLFIFLATWKNTAGSETDGNAPESPTCSSATLYDTNVTNAPFFDTFLAAYTETVDTIVGLQTSTWNYLDRYKSFDESTVEGLCESKNSAHLYTNIPKFARSAASSKQDKTTITDTIAKLAWDIPDDFNNDKESDIDGYFKELADGCTKDIDSPEAADAYTKECFNRIKDIVWEPKCTTRYDSRVKCDGKTLPAELSTPSELIAEHFGSSDENSDQEPLHVVIIGSGPIGLMLGNALSMLQRNSDTSTDIPPIKILYLETRADAPGVKKPYTRNWQAHLSLLHFRDRIDPRILKIVASMTEDKDDPESSTGGFVFPLNILETLLMLSNRDLGASKFLFGVNPLDVVDDLKKINNLILVDATGHRLEPLRRGSNCDGKGEEICTNDDLEDKVILNHRTPAPPSIPWKNSQTSDFYDNLLTFQNDFTGWHEMLEKRGQHLHLGQSGDVIYPIDESTKAAKSMMWLDIHGALPLMSSGFARELLIAKETNNLYASDGPFCEWCKDWNNDEAEDFLPTSMEEEIELSLMCDNLCFVQYFSQSTTLLRQDINQNIFNDKFRDTFVTHRDSWFPIMGYSFNPSRSLAGVAENVLISNGFGGHPIGMPLKEFYPALLKAIYHGNYTYVKGEDINVDLNDEEYDSYSVDLSDADWELVEAIERYTYQATTTKWPTVTMYVQRPFIYTNGIKKKNRCGSSTDIGDYLEHAPMLRFGDSFTTGDGLAGAGFFTHASMIGVFMDLIRDKSSSASEMS